MPPFKFARLTGKAPTRAHVLSKAIYSQRGVRLKPTLENNADRDQPKTDAQ